MSFKIQLIKEKYVNQYENKGNSQKKVLPSEYYPSVQG